MQQIAHRGGNGGGNAREVDRLVQRRADDLGDRVAGERRAAGEQFVKHAAEGEDIGALIDLAAPGLLGAHVSAGAHDLADHGGRVVALGRSDGRRERGGGIDLRVIDGSRKAEIEHLHPAIRSEHDVAGLEIAVDDSLLVGDGESRGDLSGERKGLRDGKHAPCEQRGESLALDVLEHEIVGAVPLFEAVDCANAGVTHESKYAGLALEPGQTIGAGRDMCRQSLDGDIAIEPGIAGQIDLAHSAPAKFSLDHVRTDPRVKHGDQYTVRNTGGGRSPKRGVAENCSQNAVLL